MQYDAFDFIQPRPDGKKCSKCGILKSASQFYKDIHHPRQLSSHCIQCRKKADKKRRKIPDRKKNQHLKHYYGITAQTYRQMEAEQDGVCAICKQPEKAILNGKTKHLAVDHCHATKKVRGLLCSNCNNAIGKFKDDINLLYSAIEYLNIHK